MVVVVLLLLLLLLQRLLLLRLASAALKPNSCHAGLMRPLTSAASDRPLLQSEAELEGAEGVLSGASLGVATLSMKVDFLDDPLKKAALDSLASHLADYLALVGGCAGVSAAAAAALKRSAPFAPEEGEEPRVDPTPDNATPADAAGAAEGAVAMEQA